MLGSGQPGPRLGLDNRNVGTIDQTIGVNVVAEVRTGHGLTRLRLDQAGVRGVDKAIAIRIADEESDGDAY